MELNRLFFTTIAIAVTLAFHFTQSASQEVENEREFSYQICSGVGPNHWGLIHEEWTQCNKGNMQSPIDLLDHKVKTVWGLGKLQRRYRPSSATMVNRGHDIMLKWKDGAGGIWVNGTKYLLKQLHWHGPTEHKMNGKRFALELHMVHESVDHKFAVVAILYKIGRSDTFLSELERYIHAIKNMEHAEEEVGIVDPRHVKMGSRKYYRYIGSLTTPPCTEGVVWTIVKKVRTVSTEQVRLLRDAVHDESEMNARPVQPLNCRGVELYGPQTS